jgi:tellurite resistance protein TerC
VLIEATDVVFAVDSIPAILAVTRSEFIVFSSNAFAILGLRALYFLLSGAAGKLRYLNVGLGIILAYVGVKMLLADVYHIPTLLSLAVIAAVLTVTVVLSLRAGAPGPARSTPRRRRRTPYPRRTTHQASLRTSPHRMTVDR